MFMIFDNYSIEYDKSLILKNMLITMLSFITSKFIIFFMNNQNILVTGGAGFIGNSLVKYLLNNNNKVTVFDNFSAENNLKDLKSTLLTVIEGDLSNLNDYELLDKNFDLVFHLAADPEVRLSVTTPESIYRNNILATFNLLEWIKETKIAKIIFISTSAVYGDPQVFPTPESEICIPISLYAGSKVACESLLSSYSHTYRKCGITIRLANVVGPKSNHGILFDMFKKLSIDNKQLEILGDGTQNKSYLYIDDCVFGIVKISESQNKSYHIFNLGSDSQIKVTEIVDIILKEKDLNDVKKFFTGGLDNGRGWIGDVKIMLLDSTKAKSLGWNSKYDSFKAIEKTVKDLVLKNLI